MITFFAVILIIFWLMMSIGVANGVAEDYKHFKFFYWTLAFVGMFSLPAWLPMVLWRAFT